MVVKGLGEDVATYMPRRKIVLRRSVTPQRVRLPSGQSILARYERVSRWNLPQNVTVKRTTQIGPRSRRGHKKQAGGNILGTIAKLGTKPGAKALDFTAFLKKR